MAFTQNGTIGTVYIDGAQVAQNTAMTNLPSLTLPKAGMTGTLYNWLGRSCYPGDVYLRQTLLYDFQLLSVPLTSDDLIAYISVSDSITKLNNAYAENPDIILPELTTEEAALNLGDLSAVKTNLTFPSTGTLDRTISISWSSKNTALIANDGTVTRPNYYNCNDTLVATLTKAGQKLIKSFPATVIVKDGTTFTGNLLVKFDFATVSDSIVTDAAEKHFTGTLKNKAYIKTIGSTTKFNVLNLGDSINGAGYLDLGQAIGQVLYHQTDYTMSCYYRVNESYTGLTSNGNFLWTFSNTNAALSNPAGGYLIGSLKDQSVSITPGYYTVATGNQAVSFATAALVGGWHNLTYTQSGTIGTLYVDGMPVATGAVTNLLSTALPKSGKMGTIYNWIGRSCYAADAYLRKTLVYDFRLYNKALTAAEIQTDVLNIGTVIGQLDQAYNESLSGVQSIQNSPYKVIPTNGAIQIIGLTGNEKVSIFDITGRQLKVVNVSRITTNEGIYFVKVDNYVAKVIVK